MSTQHSSAIKRDEEEPNFFEGMDSELESLLLEGINSGPGKPATIEFWNELKSRLKTIDDESAGIK